MVRFTWSPFSCAVAVALAAAWPLCTTAQQPAIPAWLTLRPGTVARVDVAPWPSDDGPEAAVAASARSIEHYGGDELVRPDDVVHEPVGVRVIVVRLLARRIALVRGVEGHWTAYTRIERLIPEIPAGTPLLVAGGFEGFADFFPSLETPSSGAGRIETGARLVGLKLGIAPLDQQSSALVRVKVLVRSGSRSGQVGWLQVGYTGLPHPPRQPASNAERVCRCRIVQFGDSGE